MMQEILVTGAAGYIGRQVVRSLAAQGIAVHAAARMIPPDTDGASWIAADLLNATDRRRLIETVRPTHLLQLAWITTHSNYWTSFENLDWLAATLDLARLFGEIGGRRFVAAGTCMERMVPCGTAISVEPAPLYSVSKSACRLVLDRLSRDFDFKFAWGRVYFSYGEHEHPARLVPTIIRSLLAGEEANCTSGIQRRDFMHVRDLGAAFATLLLSECEGIVDVGTGDAVRIADLARLIGELMEKPQLIRLGALPNRSGEPRRLVADPRRLRDEIGFVPRYSLEEGLRETIAWWKEAG